MSDRLAQNLLRLMAERGTNPKQLAREAGLGATYIRDIIDGRSGDPMPSKLRRVAVVLGVTLDELNCELVQQPEEPGTLPLSDQRAKKRTPFLLDDNESGLVEAWRDFEPDERNDVAMAITRIASKRIRRV